MTVSAPPNIPSLICIGCRRAPADLDLSSFLEPGQTPDQFVWEEEGTLNHDNGHFLCDGCYIQAGMPSSPSGWKCP